MRRRNVCLVGPLVALQLAGCTCSDQDRSVSASAASGLAAQRAGAPAPSGAQTIEGPLVLPLRRTTAPEAVLENLFSTEKQLEQRLRKQPKRVDIRGQLITTLLVQVLRLGKVSKLARIVSIADVAVRQHPKRGEAHLLRARARAAVLQLGEAQKSLDQARELKLAQSALEPLQATIHAEAGKLDAALAIFERLATTRPGYDILGELAAVLGRQGRYAKADETFERALANYKSVSPLVVARLHFERGHMRQRAGDEAKARQLYRAALHHFPQYAPAALGLAPLLPTKQAIDTLRVASEEADDPEYMGRLALLLDKQQAGSGKDQVKRARARYAELLQRFPKAFAERGAWFHLEVAVEPERAVELARLNVKGRPTPQAQVLLLTALIQAENKQEACKRGRRAEARAADTKAQQSGRACPGAVRWVIAAPPRVTRGTEVGIPKRRGRRGPAPKRVDAADGSEPVLVDTLAKELDDAGAFKRVC